MNSASLGQFGRWVFPYIPHHVIVKEDVMNLASLGQFGTWAFPYIPHHVIVKEEGL